MRCERARSILLQLGRSVTSVSVIKWALRVTEKCVFSAVRVTERCVFSVNLKGAKKHHVSMRDMMATSSHVFSSISSGGTQMGICSSLFIVSERTNKRHHHHLILNAANQLRRVSCTVTQIQLLFWTFLSTWGSRGHSMKNKLATKSHRHTFL